MSLGGVARHVVGIFKRRGLGLLTKLVDFGVAYSKLEGRTETSSTSTIIKGKAPYLSPEPVRNVKTNEPAFVAHTARVAAGVKGMAYEEFDRAITETAVRFYQWR